MHMTTVASRDLRNHTSEVLRRVADGGAVTVTVHGRAVAVLSSIDDSRPTFVSREQFLAGFHRADPGLADDLRELAGETTDDLGPVQ